MILENLEGSKHDVVTLKVHPWFFCWILILNQLKDDGFLLFEDTGRQLSLAHHKSGLYNYFKVNILLCLSI